MAAKTKDRLVAIYFYEDSPFTLVEVYGIYPVEEEKPNVFEWFDLFNENGDCLNLGDPFYTDDLKPPTWQEVKDSIA